MTIRDDTDFRNDWSHPEVNFFVQQHEGEKNKLVELIEITKPLGGAIAEVGVCEGGSALFISNAEKERPIHLFDTFLTLPDGTNKNACAANFLAKPFEIVRERFKGRNNVYIHPGLFPQETGRYVADLKFSFVHIDVDIYRSLMDCMGFFYYRMLKGGAMVVHDLGEPTFHRQVERAINDFFYCKTEKLNRNLTQVYCFKQEEEKPMLLPDKNDPDKVDKIIDYLKRREMEGAWWV